MADRKLEIEFHKSMTADKRNVDFAYLRKNIADVPEKGLYPAKNFTQVEPTSLSSSGVFLGVYGSTYNLSVVPTRPKVVFRTGASSPYTYTFYPFGESSSTLDTFSGSILAITRANDGNINFVDDVTNKVYRLDNLGGTIAEDATFPSGISLSDITFGLNDGLYNWWIGGEIWRQLPGEVPEQIISDTGFFPFAGNIFGKEMVLIDRSSRTESLRVFIWDKENIFFDERILIKGEDYLSSFVMDSNFYLVTWRIEKGNQKEVGAKMIVYVMQNGVFTELNSIKIALPTNYLFNRVPLSNSTTVLTDSGDNNKYAVVSVNIANTDDADKNPDLFVNYVYKVFKDGTVEVMAEPTDGSTMTPIVCAGVYGLYDFYIDKPSGASPRIFINYPDNIEYDDYDTYTSSTYITNFYTNPYNEHRLDAFSISFEKLFKNSGSSLSPEELDIYYRTSDREEWVLLANITAQKIIDNVDLRQDYTIKNIAIPVKSQRYQLTKMPDGTALPEFNEIQFKFVPKNGFSIIGAWFEYSYITRNTKK